MCGRVYIVCCNIFFVLLCLIFLLGSNTFVRRSNVPTASVRFYTRFRMRIIYDACTRTVYVGVYAGLCVRPGLGSCRTTVCGSRTCRQATTACSSVAWRTRSARRRPRHESPSSVSLSLSLSLSLSRSLIVANSHRPTRRSSTNSCKA